MASCSASRVRASARRNCVFSLENISSIGEKSGEYPGKKRSQTNVGATLIDDDELSGVQVLDLFSPSCSCLLVAFRGTQRLFFRVQPSRLIARLIVDVLTCTPWCSFQS